MKQDISTMKQLEDFGEELLCNSSPTTAQATLITLTGDLGAGKTTLVQTLGTQLGITDSITSPTYVIEQRYAIKGGAEGTTPWTTLVHIDAYRLENPDDPEKIGLPETLANPNNLVIIEWPEKIAEFLKDYQKIEVSLHFANDERTVKIS